MIEMQVQLLSDAAVFADRVQAVIAADPFTSSVLTGMVARAREENRATAGALWMVLIDHGTVVGAAMHTPPYHPFLPRLPEGAAAAVAVELLRIGRPVAGVTGERAAVDEFARTWVARTGGSSSVVTSMRMYRLGALTAPAGVPGSVRCATGGDLTLVAEWVARFAAEATPDSPGDDPTAVARRRITRGEVWLWDDQGRAVSLAAGSPPADGVSRIGPVYTPPEFRRRGYGAAVTARATRACLDAGARHVVLYTDLVNPVSNSIYQKIGYRPDHDALERRLHPSPAEPDQPG